MIPAAETILRGYPFTARRFGVRALANVDDVEAAIDLARTLGTTP